MHTTCLGKDSGPPAKIARDERYCVETAEVPAQAIGGARIMVPVHSTSKSDVCNDAISRWTRRGEGKL